MAAPSRPTPAGDAPRHPGPSSAGPGVAGPGVAGPDDTGPNTRVTGRGVELGLLVAAAAITTAALVSVELDQQHALDPALGYLGIAYLGLFAAAHLAVRRWATYADPLILPAVALLTGLGLVMIHRLDLAGAATAALSNEPTPSADAIRQLAWAGRVGGAAGGGDVATA